VHVMIFLVLNFFCLVSTFRVVGQGTSTCVSSAVLGVASMLLLCSAPFNLICPYSLRLSDSFSCLHVVRCDCGLFLLLLSFIVFVIYLFTIIIITVKR